MLVRDHPNADTAGAVPEANIEPMTLTGHPDHFAARHIGPDAAEARAMLEVLGHDSMEGFIDTVVPPSIRSARPLNLPPALSEYEALAALKRIISRHAVVITVARASSRHRPHKVSAKGSGPTSSPKGRTGVSH